MQAIENGILAWNALKLTPGLGPKRLAELVLKLVKQGKRGSDLLGASVQDLMDVGLSSTLAERASELLADPFLPMPAPEGAVLLTPDDPAFPVERIDPKLPLPVLLYAAGNISLLRGRAIGISGSRSAPAPALEITSRIAAILARKGINVVSGYATGVDQTAHSAALNDGGSTTAVLAEGLLGVSPRLGSDSADEGSFLFVCGFKPDARWTVYQAMERNKWIAALADAVIVVASGIRGGSWSQGQLCLDAGKRLIVPDFSEDIAPGNRRLIEQGAVPLDPHDPESILDRSVTASEAATVSDQKNLFG